jgi:hypothetical protein
MDMEFEKLVDSFDEGFINTTAAREHVGDIERGIRFIEERARSVLSELPFKHCMPDAFVIHLMMFVVFWINAFPSDSGVSSVHSPREIVTGLKIDYSKHCRARWGSYVEASDDLDVTNTMRDRTSPSIVLGPTGNIQGSVRCYNLETKSVVKRRTITPLPMPGRVIRRVLELGKRSKQKRKSEHLQFLNRIQQEFDWVVEETAGLVEREPHETDAIPDEIPGVSLESDFISDVIVTPHLPLTLSALQPPLQTPISPLKHPMQRLQEWITQHQLFQTMKTLPMTTTMTMILWSFSVKT